MILSLIAQYGEQWSKISETLDSKWTGKQIREHYLNKLHPSITNKKWTREEDDIIWEQYLAIGPRWKEIATKLNGRPENAVKNRFHGKLKKKLKGDQKLLKLSQIQKQLEKQEDEEALFIEQKLEPIDEEGKEQTKVEMTFTEDSQPLQPQQLKIQIIPEDKNKKESLISPSNYLNGPFELENPQFNNSGELFLENKLGNDSKISIEKALPNSNYQDFQQNSYYQDQVQTGVLMNILSQETSNDDKVKLIQSLLGMHLQDNNQI